MSCDCNNERLAVVETHIRTIYDDVKEIKTLVEPLNTHVVYTKGQISGIKVVLGLLGTMIVTVVGWIFTYRK